jgi:hypothetical protein
MFACYKLLINCLITFLLQRSTLILLAAMNGGLFAAILLVMHFAVPKNDRVTVLGSVCTFVSIRVYVAPVSIMVSELNII